MRGEILHYDDDQRFGFISGADGNRYTFAREDLRHQASIERGAIVEFQPSGGKARDIFPISAQTTSAKTTSAKTTSAQTIGPTAATPQPGGAPATPHQHHFGRLADVSAPESTGLWSYFWRALTQNYVNFAGRARRKEYWSYFLFWTISVLVVTCVGLVLDDAMGNFDGNESAVTTVGLSIFFILATFLPSLGLTVRRIHDIGLSGWFYLLVFIPSVGSLIILVFALIPTQGRENRWGPVPGGVRI